MKLRTFPTNTNIEGKRILIRIDANVPIVKGKVVDGPHGRIARSALDINYLAHRGAKVIVIAHLGRPNGRRVPAYSLKPVAKRLSSLLGTNVKLSKDIVGAPVLKAVQNMKNGDVLLLENIRFEKREETNDPSFAKALAELADLYINDAFGVCHRAHASTYALSEQLPSYAGPLLSNEVAVLSKLETQTKHPFVLVMGGVKIETKLPVIQRFAHDADAILLGGALATTVLAAKGFCVGKSVHDAHANAVLSQLPKAVLEKIFLPTDVVVASSLRADARVSVKSIEEIGAKDHVLDLGPKTIEQFTKSIGSAKTIVWNGPLGYCEMEAYRTGTKQIAQAIADRTGPAVTIVGGGDTMPILEQLNVADQFTLLSTGGGAMLEYLANKTLPCLEILS